MNRNILVIVLVIACAAAFVLAQRPAKLTGLQVAPLGQPSTPQPTSEPTPALTITVEPEAPAVEPTATGRPGPTCPDGSAPTIRGRDEGGIHYTCGELDEKERIFEGVYLKW